MSTKLTYSYRLLQFRPFPSSGDRLTCGFLLIAGNESCWWVNRDSVRIPRAFGIDPEKYRGLIDHVDHAYTVNVFATLGPEGPLPSPQLDPDGCFVWGKEIRGVMAAETELDSVLGSLEKEFVLRFEPKPD